VLARALEAWFATGSEAPLDAYGPTAVARVWRVQDFSYRMTTMMHTPPGADAFDVRRQHGELDSLTGSRAGRTFLAEAYTGWPLPGVAA
jgi:p-hydroxybenzoate 3-monooxygenase